MSKRGYSRCRDGAWGGPGGASSPPRGGARLVAGGEKNKKIYGRSRLHNMAPQASSSSSSSMVLSSDRLLALRGEKVKNLVLASEANGPDVAGQSLGGAGGGAKENSTSGNIKRQRKQARTVDDTESEYFVRVQYPNHEISSISKTLTSYAERVLAQRRAAAEEENANASSTNNTSPGTSTGSSSNSKSSTTSSSSSSSSSTTRDDKQESKKQLSREEQINAVLQSTTKLVFNDVDWCFPNDTIPSSGLQDLFSMCPNLRELGIVDCEALDGLETVDGSCGLPGGTSSLEVLTLQNTGIKNLDFLASDCFRNLKTLSVQGSEHLGLREAEEGLAAVPQLEVLEARGSLQWYTFYKGNDYPLMPLRLRPEPTEMREKILAACPSLKVLDGEKLLDAHGSGILFSLSKTKSSTDLEGSMVGAMAAKSASANAESSAASSSKRGRAAVDKEKDEKHAPAAEEDSAGGKENQLLKKVKGAGRAKTTVPSTSAGAADSLDAKRATKSCNVQKTSLQGATSSSSASSSNVVGGRAANTALVSSSTSSSSSACIAGKQVKPPLQTGPEPLLQQAIGSSRSTTAAASTSKAAKVAICAPTTTSEDVEGFRVDQKKFLDQNSNNPTLLSSSNETPKKFDVKDLIKYYQAKNVDLQNKTFLQPAGDEDKTGSEEDNDRKAREDGFEKAIQGFSTEEKKLLETKSGKILIGRTKMKEPENYVAGDEQASHAELVVPARARAEALRAFPHMAFKMKRASEGEQQPSLPLPKVISQVGNKKNAGSETKKINLVLGQQDENKDTSLKRISAADHEGPGSKNPVAAKKPRGRPKKTVGGTTTGLASSGAASASSSSSSSSSTSTGPVAAAASGSTDPNPGNKAASLPMKIIKEKRKPGRPAKNNKAPALKKLSVMKRVAMKRTSATPAMKKTTSLLAISSSKKTSKGVKAKNGATKGRGKNTSSSSSSSSAAAGGEKITPMKMGSAKAKMNTGKHIATASGGKSKKAVNVLKSSKKKSSSKAAKAGKNSTKTSTSSATSTSTRGAGMKKSSSMAVMKKVMKGAGK